MLKVVFLYFCIQLEICKGVIYHHHTSAPIDVNPHPFREALQTDNATDRSANRPTNQPTDRPGQREVTLAITA